MKQGGKAAESRNKIMQAAIQEFGMKGYKMGSTNGICEACGISKGLVFYHFNSKEQLFEEAATQCMSEFDNYMQKNFVKGDTTLDGIRGCCHIRKDFFTMYPNYHRIFCDVLYVGRGQGSSAASQLRRLYEKHSFEIISRILEDVELNEGISREENIWLAVRLIEFIDMEIGNRYQEQEHVDKLMLDEQMKQYEGYLEALLYGLLKR